MDEPDWLKKSEVLILHEVVLQLTGGAAGIRDEALLESALARPRNVWSYEGVDEIVRLAAVYGVGVAKNHPFVDGNKRAAFLALGLFLENNGLRLVSEEDDATSTMLAVAAGDMDIDALADWIRANSVAA